MARIRAIDGEQRWELGDGWELTIAGPERPPEHAEWTPAIVPGTAAQAIEKTHENYLDLIPGLQQRHVWYRRTFSAPAGTRLRFSGLAPHAHIWLGNRHAATAKSMFDASEVVVESAEETTLYLHFPPYTAETLPAPKKRQRWRPHLIAGPHLRNAYTTPLGHMPGWCPSAPPVGPYRPVELVVDGPVRARNARVRSWLGGTTGHIEISIEISGMEGPLVASCWSAHAPLQRGDDGLFHARLEIENPPLWWPHTHGDPHLLPLNIYGEDIEIALGSVGFRTLECDRGTDGRDFAIRVNGTPIFCRGPNWTPPDIVALSGAYEAYEPLLRRMRDGGMNMLRISGIMTREAPELFDIADKLGILVWLDQPFANFDYDFDFMQENYDIAGSLQRYLTDIETAPSLAVVCGGSEMAQQAAMLSLPESVWNLAESSKKLESVTNTVRPDVICVPNSPYGGELPFQNDAGVAHYFGVGAYQRPLEDARRAGVRFASECLAFANLPQPERMAANAGGAEPGTPEWKARVVRDLKADWDFEDTRDFYLKLLYGTDPARLRAEDPERYLALSAAAPGEVMENTFAEWRRTGSCTNGGLVWFFKDVQPGFGWGVVDFAGVPKPPYYALRRAFQPLTVGMTDEGLNGLYCHVINERGLPGDSDLTLTLTAYAEDGSVVMDGARQFSLRRGERLRLTSAEIFGIFFDVTYAYRFGPPAHVAAVARLTDGGGNFLAEAFHFPHGRGHAQANLGLSARLESDGAGQHVLVLNTERLAQSVHIAVEGFEPADDWFHLAPGEGRRVVLRGRGTPKGVITALNGIDQLTFG